MSPDELAFNAAEAIRRDLIAIGLDADLDAVPKLAAYRQLLERWNTTYNLTGTKASSLLQTLHLADCLAAIPSLRESFAGSAAVHVLDVGSGAGLPGIVFAIFQPTWRVDCVDAVGKKAAFIRQAAGQLALRNLRAIHARVESIPPSSSARYDLIVSRAFSSLRDFVELTRPLMKESGIWVAMKGKIPEQELAALPKDVAVSSIRHIDVPNLAADRCLITIRLNSSKDS